MAEGSATLVPLRARWLGAFALGTFHVILLVWLFVALGFRGGSLGETLDDLGTLPGLAIFGLIWAVVGGISAIAILGLPRGTSTDAAEIVHRGFIVGLRSGAIVIAPFAVLAAVGVPLAAISEGLSPDDLAQALGGLLFGGIALALGALAGALLASLFTFLDLGALAIVHIITRRATPEAELEPAED